MPPDTATEGRRILVTAPFGRDAESLVDLLGHHGYEARLCAGLVEIAAALDEVTGAILLTEEALRTDLDPLERALAGQPPWSDIPFVVLLFAVPGRGTGPAVARERLRLPETATNVIMLERPLGAESLLSALGAALRSRRRQFDTRDRIRELADSRAALAASEAELRRITDALPILVGFVDRDLRYRFANHAYREWADVEPADVLGRTVREVLGEAGYESRRWAIERALAGEAVLFELAWPRRDGTRREAELRYLPRRDPEGAVDGFHVFVSDITDRKRALEDLEDAAALLERRVAARTEELQAEMASRARAEAALRQSQKMEAVGQLTGGIAHDFNNMLTGVIGGLAIVRRRIAAGRLGDIDRFMEAASTSAQRAAALTGRLLAFSRRQSLDVQPTDINAVVGSLDDLLRRTLGEHVALAVEPARALPAAVTDANQLENAILNLAINARDAMPDGGALRIGTRFEAVGPAGGVGAEAAAGAGADAVPEEVPPGCYVVLTVADTGVGMAPDVLDKVFEPFFTTKPIGQGTGLGLSMVYGFVRQTGGRVRIDSAPGKGTTISLYLPVAEGDAAPAAEDAASTPFGEGQCVLVVEDDPSVRLLIREVLSELGYSPIEAPDPGQATRHLHSHQPIDLMISDVGLPGMNGRQLAEIAREARPDLPILFVTGYAENAAIRAGFLGTNMAMVTKPFSLETLAQKVSAMLPQRGA